MEQVKIGWARRDISTTEPVKLPGQAYLRISTGIHDPLYATALCVEGGEEAVIFLSCDMVGIRGGVLAMIREKAAAMCSGIPVDAIVINATHTHASPAVVPTEEFSPDGQPIYPGTKYREFFVTMCAEAVCEAWTSRKAGGIGYGYGYAVVGHSRRVIYFTDQGKANPMSIAPNGHGVMYGKTNHPEFSHYEAGADHFLNLMFTFDASQKLTGIVVNVPCPSQLAEHFTSLSADYWHEVRELVKKEYGEDVFVLPQCAAAGDLAPRILHYQAAQRRRMWLKYGVDYSKEACDDLQERRKRKAMVERYDIAERILEGIRDVYSWAKKDIQTHIPVCHVRKVIPLKARKISDRDAQDCREALEAMEAYLEDAKKGTPEEMRVTMSRYEYLRKAKLSAIERYETQEEDPRVDTEHHAVRIGDIAFVTNRYELYMDFMHRLQARSPFLQTFVIQLAGDEGGSYAPTERGTNNKGYSAVFSVRGSFEGGQQWVEEMLTTLEQIKETT